MLLAGIPSLLSGILLYEWEQQRKHSKAEEPEKEQKHAALVKGVEALLRDRLIIGMEECINKGCCTSRGRCGNPPLWQDEILYFNHGGQAIPLQEGENSFNLLYVPGEDAYMGTKYSRYPGRRIKLTEGRK